MSKPTATYRLQLTPDFGFAEARTIVPYLASLGISHLYLSPIHEARKGSTHGYDVTDPTQIRGELGGEAGFIALASAAREHGLGIVLDIIPNHMAASVESPWWRDVLEHGRASPFAEFFDIDWDRPAGNGRGRVVLPILEASLDETMEAGGLSLELRPVGPVVVHGDVALPLDPVTTPRILSQGAGTAWAQELPAPLAEVALVLEHLPPRDATPSDVRAARRTRARAALDTLWELYQEDALARHVIDRALAAHDPAELEGRGRLERLLADQPWWPIPWRVADEVINYRRFFTINDLVGLRVEEAEVFDKTHALVARLLAEGWVDGLRVDHVDGLRDPGGYLERLRRMAGASTTIVVEKILGRSEPLRRPWPIEGTTGYDFLGMANGLLVDSEGFAFLARDYAEQTGREPEFEKVAVRRKRETARAHFSGAMRALAEEILPLAQLDPRGHELSAGDLERALVEVTARLPVYRTYLGEGPPHPHDEAALAFAFSEARRASDVPAPAYDVLEAILRGENRGLVELRAEGGDSPVPRDRGVEATRTWQQLSGAIMAKGVEDAAFYVYNPLISLNEVGSDPDFGTVSRREFHAWCAERAADWPGSLSATSTHDTKRSEDVRARIAVLSEIPERWAAALERWRALNDSRAEVVGGERAPSPAGEVALYQTLIGAWPLDATELPSFRERVSAYLPKAIREAGIRSRWDAPSIPYEEAVVRFALRLMEGAEAASYPDAVSEDRFLVDFLPFQRQVAFHGMLNSLAQTVLKLCAPGVPDIYQGCESWRFSLVDPDNRRAVDYASLEAAQEGLVQSAGTARPTASVPADLFRDLASTWEDGRLKQLVTWRLLALRRALPDVFARGQYLPLEVTGTAARHVIAFARRLNRQCVVVIVPIHTARLMAGRASTILDPGPWSGTDVVPPPGLERARWTSVLGYDPACGDGHLHASTLPGVFWSAEGRLLAQWAPP